MNAEKTESKEILYGVHPVLEFLRSGRRTLDKLYVLRGRKGPLIDEMIQLARGQGATFHFESRVTLDRLATHGKHQGIIAFVAAKAYGSLEEIKAVARGRDQSLFVLVLDEVQDPRNLGAILRTAEAAGVHGVIVPRHRSVGLTGTTLKTSAGALEHIVVARVANLSQTVEELKKDGLWIVALEPEGGQLYSGLDYQGPIGIVIGGEGKGIREGLLRHCDYQVSIPMKGRVESLNVSVAVGILVYEVLRQRG
jgi:23S rRNA (guanosine2251-2'-O)-methyltransferase